MPFVKTSTCSGVIRDIQFRRHAVHGVRIVSEILNLFLLCFITFCLTGT